MNIDRCTRVCRRIHKIGLLSPHLSHRPCPVEWRAVSVPDEWKFHVARNHCRTGHGVGAREIRALPYACGHAKFGVETQPINISCLPISVTGLARWNGGRSACQMSGSFMSQGITVAPATELGRGRYEPCFSEHPSRFMHECTGTFRNSRHAQICSMSLRHACMHVNSQPPRKCGL